ncbi:DNA-directed RNA polymerase subunit beta [Bacillus sp. AGMB 02131]|uniref:DNA-directed RNA polymerase subunit beta n=1 Tax=Peribacillus faecalis TaxID=2772559 RepID=A0A927CYT7_9BACI|nr:DNA-directed RNA polymerase subunit beta [Peribacillus faecalis]MBD3110208.1 DNA-directed RNA polymerase subunit beta [Peribacillus faecalis]
MEEKVLLREDHKQLQLQEPKEEPRIKIRIRLVPIWLRIIAVIAFVMLAFTIGSMIGYGVLGDGNPTDVLQKSTWTSITDLVNKDN